MDLLFVSRSWVFSTLLIVIPITALTLLILWIVRKCVSNETLKKNHDVAGFTFSIIGVLYSVILGYTVINVQTRYSQVEETIHVEATMLVDLYRDAGFFPEANRALIRTNLRQYVDYVVSEEWKLRSNQFIHIGSQKILQTLWQSYFNIDLSDVKAKIWYEQCAAKLDALMNARLARQFNSWEHLGSMMWTLLIVGAMVTVSFMFFFGLDNLHSQMLMTGLLVSYLTFILYLVFSLDHVFTGSQGIQPTALERVYVTFDSWDKEAT